MFFLGMIRNPLVESKRYIIAYCAICSKWGNANERRDLILGHGLGAIKLTASQKKLSGGTRYDYCTTKTLPPEKNDRAVGTKRR